MNSEGPCGNFEVQIKRSTPAEQHYANSLNRLFSLNRINHFTHESSKKIGRKYCIKKHHMGSLTCMVTLTLRRL